MNQYKRLSQYLCKLLRHQPELVGLVLDEYGNARVDELIDLVNQKSKFTISREILETIVREDEKGRYVMEDGLIRCVQGHSIPIIGTLKNAPPPDILYHGTSSHVIEKIMLEGIQKMNRNYVHLSIDIPTAVKVGKRHGEVVILEVDCKQMVEDGYQFKIAENGVWQIISVPPKYIEIIEA